MRHYTRSGIMILNDVTKELKNLNGLGRYLSRQIDINALKTLKLMILSQQTGKIDKKLDINASEKMSSLDGSKRTNIVGNLSLNPQNFALELLQYLSNNCFIDYSFECYDKFSILENWLNSFRKMDFCDTDLFYKRYDMIDKKMDIIEFLIKNGLLKKSQINSILYAYQKVLSSYTNFSKEQLQRMYEIIDIMTRYYRLHNRISNSKQLSKEEKDIQHKLIDEQFSIYRKPKIEVFNDCKNNAEIELDNYMLEQQQYSYIKNEIPRLIKEKIIL